MMSFVRWNPSAIVPVTAVEPRASYVTVPILSEPVVVTAHGRGAGGAYDATHVRV